MSEETVQIKTSNTKPVVPGKLVRPNRLKGNPRLRLALDMLLDYIISLEKSDADYKNKQAKRR
jgi:hypothetical protein